MSAEERYAGAMEDYEILYEDIKGPNGVFKSYKIEILSDLRERNIERADELLRRAKRLLQSLLDARDLLGTFYAMTRKPDKEKIKKVNRAINITGVFIGGLSGEKG